MEERAHRDQRQEGTKTFDVPLWDLLPARAYTAAILRVCYSAWETLDRQGRTPGSLRESDLVRELAGAGLEQSTAEMCASLCSDVDWTAKSPLSAWLKAIRSFYSPKSMKGHPPRGSQTSQNEEGRMSTGRMTLEV